MRLREAYEYALIESNKLKAPSLLLEDYIYLFNKAIQQYINSVYSRVEYNQQSVDDLSFLQTVTIIDKVKLRDSSFAQGIDCIWDIELPKDYLHLLNCMVELRPISSTGQCGMSSQAVVSPCNRLTADLYPGIINNYYMKPSYKKPYYYIINNNTNQDSTSLEGTNPIQTNEVKEGTYNDDLFLKTKYDRTAHQSTVRMEIHTGKPGWTVEKVYLTYLKAPMYVSMTLEDLMEIEDETQVLEFPDYVCYEIINIFVRLLLENAGDPRLSTNMGVNQSISIPQESN